MAFDVKRLCTYIIIILISVGCKQSTELLGGVGSGIGKLTKSSDSGSGDPQEVNSTVDEKSEGGKTSDEGEGVPGYLVDPNLVELGRSGDMLTAIARAGNAKSSRYPLASLWAYVWTVEQSVFLSQTGDSWAGLASSAILGQRVAINSDGGFEFSLNAKGQVLILVIENKPDISALEVKPRANENYNTYFVDFSDPTANLRALPSSPNVMLLLTERDCPKCSLRNAWLVGENFERTNFSEADLTGAKFTGATLINADFTGATLSQADFTNANLQEARLRNASATGAKFVGANLRDANLDGANLSGADTTGADLTNAEITPATTLP